MSFRKSIGSIIIIGSVFLGCTVVYWATTPFRLIYSVFVVIISGSKHDSSFISFFVSNCLSKYDASGD